MNKEEELKILKNKFKELNELPYQTLFKLIILLENKSLSEVEEMDVQDLNFLDQVYYEYMESDLAGMISEDLKEMFEHQGGEW